MLSLDQLATEFIDWRKRKPHRSSPVPKQLKQEAFKLARAHGYVVVAKRLGCTVADLKRVSGETDPPQRVPGLKKSAKMIMQPFEHRSVDTFPTVLGYQN